jgi:hypothetical protein
MSSLLNSLLGECRRVGRTPGKMGNCTRLLHHASDIDQTLQTIYWGEKKEVKSTEIDSYARYLRGYKTIWGWGGVEVQILCMSLTHMSSSESPSQQTLSSGCVYVRCVEVKANYGKLSPKRWGSLVYCRVDFK